MEKLIKSILLLSIFCIVFFINADNKVAESVVNLIYYSQYYVIVGAFITLIWILFKNKTIRILTCPIAVYYLYHLVINCIEIFNPELKDQIYTTRIINYGLSTALALALLIIPIATKIRNHEKVRNN